MAERYAVATGNWSNTATWNGGTLPAIDDDVYANGFQVTIDSNRTANTVRTTAGSVAVAGGQFIISSSVTLTLTGSGNNIIAGSNTCINFTGNSPITATIIGNVVGSATTVSGHGINCSGTGTLDFTGNTTGGAAGGAIGIVWSNGVVNITGNATGGAGSASEGLRCQGTGSLVLNGNAIASPTIATAGVRFTAAGHCTINGNSTGGSVTGTSGSAHQGPGGTMTINGNAIGGSGSTCAGASVTNTAIFTINGNAIGGSNATAYGARNTGVGTLLINGKAISATAPGVEGSTTGTTRVSSIEVGSSCIAPVIGKVEFNSLSTATAIIRNAALTQQTLTAGAQKSVFAPPSIFGGVA